MDDIVLNGQVTVNEFRRIGGIGMDTADFCRSQKNILRSFFPEKHLCFSLAFQIQLGMVTRNKVAEAAGCNSPKDCRACKTSMTGNING